MSWLLAPALGLVAAMPHGIDIDHGTLLPDGVQSSGLAPSRITSAAKVHDFLERAHCGTGQSTMRVPISDLGHVMFYVNDSQFFNATEDGIDVSSILQAVLCNNTQADGETWMTLRIDGFETFGGYDWHKISFTKGYFGGEQGIDTRLCVTADMQLPVEAEQPRRAIGFPPIHIHHSSIAPVFTRGGDSECTDVDRDPIDCNARVYGPEYCKPLASSLVIDTLLNDVRPAGSPSMRWSFQFSLRAQDPKRRSAAQLSWFQLSNPVEQILYQNFEKGVASVYFAPKKYDSYIVWSGLLPKSGTMTDRTWFHSHCCAFRRSLLFAGLPHQLGFSREMLAPVGSKCRPRRTADTAFGDNLELERHLLQASATSGARLVGASTGAVVKEADGLVYDREARVELADGWRFRKGEPFTVVSLTGPNEFGGGATFEDSEMFGMHAIWHVNYVLEPDEDDEAAGEEPVDNDSVPGAEDVLVSQLDMTNSTYPCLATRFDTLY